METAPYWIWTQFVEPRRARHAGQWWRSMPPITKATQVRRARHAGHCWRSKDELVSEVLLWTPTYGQAKAGRPARTYIQQLCEDTGCNPEDLPEERWRERVRDIRAGGTTWWWWWWWFLRLIFALHCVCLYVCDRNLAKPANFCGT